MASYDDYYGWVNAEQTCPRCGWRGLGTETRAGESSHEAVEKHCPHCGKSFGFVLYPLLRDTLNDPRAPEGDKLFAKAALQADALEKLKAELIAAEAELDKLKVALHLRAPEGDKLFAKAALQADALEKLKAELIAAEAELDKLKAALQQAALAESAAAVARSVGA